MLETGANISEQKWAVLKIVQDIDHDYLVGAKQLFLEGDVNVNDAAVMITLSSMTHP